MSNIKNKLINENFLKIINIPDNNKLNCDLIVYSNSKIDQKKIDKENQKISSLIFMIDGDEVITSNSRSVLPGVTRNSLLKLSKDLGFKAGEKEITLRELKNADEAFYCGTLSEIIRIGKIDNSKIGNAR